VTEDQKIRTLGEAVKNEETGDLEVSIGAVNEDSTASEISTTVTQQELAQLGDYLQAMRIIVLGHEERLTYIEGFLAGVFGEENEVEGNGVPESDSNDQEPLSGIEDTEGSPEDAAHEGGDDIPQQNP
jgi:hypothetical protein